MKDFELSHLTTMQYASSAFDTIRGWKIFHQVGDGLFLSPVIPTVYRTRNTYTVPSLQIETTTAMRTIVTRGRHFYAQTSKGAQSLLEDLRFLKKGAFQDGPLVVQYVLAERMALINPDGRAVSASIFVGEATITEETLHLFASEAA